LSSLTESKHIDEIASVRSFSAIDTDYENVT
jgi:hypothetical protein